MRTTQEGTMADQPAPGTPGSEEYESSPSEDDPAVPTTDDHPDED
jgi:hypothetical protein